MKKIIYCCIGMIVLAFLTACQLIGDSGEQSTHQSERAVETVPVKRGAIRPTFSVKSPIIKSRKFSLLSQEKGDFQSWLKIGDKVKAGEIVAYLGGTELVSPVDATVTNVMQQGTYPSNYPVIDLAYTGFSIDINVTDFVKTLPTKYIMNAKFQVQDGPGPSDALAVVMTSKVQEETSETSQKVDTATEDKKVAEDILLPDTEKVSREDDSLSSVDSNTSQEILTPDIQEDSTEKNSPPDINREVQKENSDVEQEQTDSSKVSFTENISTVDKKFSAKLHLLTNKYETIDVTSNESVITKESTYSKEEISMQVLISHEIDVREGQLATVVLNAEVKSNVLLLPISAVAGRSKEGVVTVVKDGQKRQAKVQLGSSDGAYIEIVTGLEEGEQVSVIPPNVDSRDI